MRIPMSRRQFAEAIGVTVGATVLTRLGESKAEASLSRGQSSDFVQLNSNENPYGLSANGAAALARSGKMASRYPDAVEDATRDAIARSHGVAPEQIVLGAGSSDVLRMADSAWLPEGRRVVAAEPTFEAVLLYARVTKAEAVKIPLTADHRHDLPKMAAAADAKTGLVYICNPNNPTGTIVSGDELDAFYARVPSSAIILVDEAYHHFVENPKYRSAVDSIGKFPNIVVARTFSKIYGMAGLRLGYAVASRENAEILRRNASWNNVNAAALDIALANLADPDHVPRERKKLNDTRRWLCAELDKDGRRYIPSETNFLMIHVGRDVAPLIGEFRAKKILVGRKFPSLSDWLRVSIGKPEETAAFLAALRQMVPARAARA
ncbi:MAG TPA: histidinol-phosphate transaminase [Thermoanaerobaculia bacterium]|nr:histidinol-phosphate transaminase [Thermoanaerobaculia bacterium]